MLRFSTQPHTTVLLGHPVGVYPTTIELLQIVYLLMRLFEAPHFQQSFSFFQSLQEVKVF